MGTLTEVLQNVTGDNPRVVILGEPSAVDLARLEALKDSKGIEVVVIDDSKISRPIKFDEPEPLILHNYRHDYRYQSPLPKHTHKRDYKFHK